MKRQRTSLLDVNVLIALFDATHVHHDVAHDWFAAEGSRSWATCPITENGFVRIMTNPRATGEYDRALVLSSLKTLCASRTHVFWSDTLSVHDDRIFDPAVIVPSQQLTDVYLLALAVRNSGRLVTFDGRIVAKAVKGAGADAIVVLGSAEPH